MGLDGAGAHTVEEFKSFIGCAGSGKIVAAKRETLSDRVASKISPWVSRLPASLAPSCSGYKSRSRRAERNAILPDSKPIVPDVI